jgi:methionyl-tRNA synthetase
MPAKMAELLDLLAVPADARGFDKATQDHRLAAETALPAPAPIFPRYIEPEEPQRVQG